MKIARNLALLGIVGILLISCAQTEVQPPKVEGGNIYSTPPRLGQPTEEVIETPVARPGESGLEGLAGSALETAPESGISEAVRSSLSVGYVNRRILEYEQKFGIWKERDAQSLVTSLDPQQTQTMVDCFRDLQRLLTGYQSLREQLLGKNSGQPALSTADIIELQKKDIEFLDGVCGKLLSTAGSAGLMVPDGAGPASGVEGVIASHYKNQAYEDVVQVWSQIPAQQREQLGRETNLRYADALLYLDQPAKAAEIYQKIVDEMSDPAQQPTDLLSLRKKLADLYTASGNFFDAQTQYEKLTAEYQKGTAAQEWTRLQLLMLERSMKGSPELTDYSELLRAYLSYIPQVDGYSVVWKAEEFLQQYPYSPVSSNVDVIKEQSMSDAEAWFTAVLAEADRLAEEKQFQQALDMLQLVPAQNLAPARHEQLKQRLDELILAEAVDRETAKIEQMQGLQRTWNEALALAESGDLDEAIVLLRGLQDTEFAARADEKIAEISEQAARTMRRTAADLFVRSTKTDDIQSRKDMLVESRRVLKDILLKYPEVDISDKVKGNISMVEKKMNELDPMLLPAIEQQEQERARAQEMPEANMDEADPFDIETPETSPVPAPTGRPLPVLIPKAIQ